MARPRGLLTARAAWWAVDQLRVEHASVLGLARQLGTTWRTVWRAVRPLLQAMADDPARFDGVNTLGVDEHIWHHVNEKDRGPRALTGMVNLTRDQAGRTRARLLDLVPGQSGKAYGLITDEGVGGWARRSLGRRRGLPMMGVLTQPNRKTSTCLTLPSPALT